MTEYIRLHRDGVGWWARYREYNLQDAYNLCTECRANPTCENPRSSTNWASNWVRL
jgi:hypothetical protein